MLSFLENYPILTPEQESYCIVPLSLKNKRLLLTSHVVSLSFFKKGILKKGIFEFKQIAAEIFLNKFFLKASKKQDDSSVLFIDGSI